MSSHVVIHKLLLQGIYITEKLLWSLYISIWCLNKKNKNKTNKQKKQEHCYFLRELKTAFRLEPSQTGISDIREVRSPKGY